MSPKILLLIAVVMGVSTAYADVSKVRVVADDTGAHLTVDNKPYLVRGMNCSVSID